MAYAGLLGAFQVLVDRGGGHIGRFLADLLEPALTTPGAFVILVGLGVAGLLIALDLPLRSLLSPATRSAKAAASTFQDRTPKAPDSGAAARNGAPLTAAASAVPVEAGRRGRAARGAVTEVPGQTGVWGDGADPGIPTAVPSTGPTSSTFAPVRVPGVAGAAGAGAAVAGAAGLATAMAPARRRATRARWSRRAAARRT